MDEIIELSPRAQAALLRVLQEGELERVGGSQTRKIDVRVVAATNENLLEAVQQGRFRADLYYRLNTFPVFIPPLRERRQDIPLLIQYFLKKYTALYQKNIPGISDYGRELLLNHPWPGNIRELENVIHHTLLICRNGVIERDDLRLSNMRIERQDDSPHGTDNSAEALLERAFQKLFEEQASALHEKVEDALLRAAYRFSHYNQVHTANLLGLSRNVTRTRLIKIGELAVNNRRPGENVQGERMLHLSI